MCVLLPTRPAVFTMAPLNLHYRTIQEWHPLIESYRVQLRCGRRQPPSHRIGHCCKHFF